MRTVRGALAALLALAALAGCGLFVQTATLVIRNDSSHVVDEVYLALVGSDWGEDRLASTIDPGQSFALRRILPGTYDVLVFDTEDGAWGTSGLELGAGEEYTLPIND